MKEEKLRICPNGVHRNGDSKCTCGMKVKDSTDNCYLTYSDELDGGGYLTCSYNHKFGEECLLNNQDPT